MKPMRIAMALLSAVMFFILAGVFMGVQLELNGTKLVVDTAADIRWQWIFIGTAVVFFFQLLRPLFQKAVKNVSGPKFIMPAIDGSTVKQKLFLIALLVIAVAPAVYGVARHGGYRHPDDDLYHPRPRVERGGRPFRPAGAGLRWVLCHRRVYLCAAEPLLRSWLLDLSPAGRPRSPRRPVSCWASRCCVCAATTPAIVTLGFGEIVRILLLNNTEITGGPNGISQIPKPTFFGLEFSRSAREGGWDTFSNFFGVKYDPSDRVIFLYPVALLLVVLSLFVINRLLRMPLGRAWEALREDEIACRSLGLSPTRIKLTAFTISAAFAGFAGTLFAARQASSARNPLPSPSQPLCWRSSCWAGWARSSR